MQRKLFIWCFSLLLAACSSGVKLNAPPPVENHNTGQTGGQNTGAQTGGTNARDVKPIVLDEMADDKAGPRNAARVIYFDYDSYAIKPDSQSDIEAHAKFLNANRARKVRLEGNTDERGGSEYNLALGQKRAEAVRRALSLLGVQENQMEAVSYGKEKPADPGHDEAAYAKNRRVEIHYE